MNATVAIERATELLAQARSHKRAEQQHRRRARSTMAEFRAFCAEHHITIDIDPRRSEPNDNQRAA